VALAAHQAGDMPVEIRRDAQTILILNRFLATIAQLGATGRVALRVIRFCTMGKIVNDSFHNIMTILWVLISTLKLMWVPTILRNDLGISWFYGQEDPSSTNHQCYLTGLGSGMLASLVMWCRVCLASFVYLGRHYTAMLLHASKR
jgi:hypothetical protein